MRIDGESQTPVGLEYRQELGWVGVGLGVSFLYSLGFMFRLWAAYDAMFIIKGGARVLAEGAVMQPFGQVLGPALAGFAVVALCMPVLAVYHYYYHYHGSKSIYLMRRLPARWELARRCLALPAAAVGAAALGAALLLGCYYGFYRLAAPEGTLPAAGWAWMS